MTAELVRVATEQRRCALYRHYDDQDVLLYVGITDGLAERTNGGHARTSEWVEFAVRAEAEWFDSREKASRAERDAVQIEEPVFNRQYAEWDVDRRITEYRHERQLLELQRTLATYLNAVNHFLDVAPPQDVKEATERMRHDFHCAEQEVDHTSSAVILRHLANIIRDRTAFFAEEAKVDAYIDMLDIVKGRLEEIQERRRKAEEPPF